jgi:hypothetical protein
LFVIADPVLHCRDHNFGDSLQRQMAIAADKVEQTLFSKFTKFVFRLGYAITESDEDVAPRESHFLFFEHDLRKESDY